jgi:uncharacterized protein (TIGR04255 family)
MKKKEMKFTNPPLNESVFGIWFDHVQGFRAPHYGLFWSKIREQFQSCSDTAPLAPPPGQMVKMEFTDIPPLPRVWFSNDETNSLLQIQPDRFLYNWRRLAGEKDYIGYPSCKDNFLKNLLIFEEFLKEEGLSESLSVRQCELTYINQAEQAPLWSSADQVGKIFPILNSTNWPENTGLPFPENFNCQFRTTLPNDYGHISAKLVTAQRQEDHQKIFQLVLTVSGPSPEASISNISDWYDAAHEHILNAFSGLTSEEARLQHWGQKDTK